MADALHLLVVDGDAMRREACVAVVRGMGLSADSCATPVEAMGHLVRRAPPQVTTLMVAGDLPGMGPVLMVRAARTLPGRQDLPLVVVGADVDLAGQARCIHLGSVSAASLGQALAALAITGNAPDTASPRVLVVDDHEVNRLLLMRALAARGVAVDTAVDGIDALAKAGRQPYALVFMDVEMPRMDGLEATRAIRRLEQGRLRRTPIIACTARNQPGDREAGLASGMDDYLIKPIALEVIEAQLERWLGLPPVVAAPVPVAPSPPSADLPLIDREVLDRIKGYGAEVLASTAGVFLQELEGRIVAMERLAEAGDCGDLFRQAHGLKGVAGSLGAKRLWRAMAAIETAGRADDLTRVRELMGTLRPVVEATVAAMRVAME